MKQNSRLYDALKVWLGQDCPWAHRAHLTTCLWMVAALIQTGSVNLPKWTTYLPCRGFFAQSKQRRVRRWLGNSRINVHRLYKPLIQAALSDWTDKCLYVSLDTSLFWVLRDSEIGGPATVVDGNSKNRLRQVESGERPQQGCQNAKKRAQVDLLRKRSISHARSHPFISEESVYECERTGIEPDSIVVNS